MIFLFEVIAVAAHLPQLRREHRLRLVPRFTVSSVLGAGLVSFMILPAYFPLTDSLRERALQERIHPDLRILLIKAERLIAEASRDSQDRALLGLHNCLVRSFHCFLESTAGNHRIDLVAIPDHF